MKRDDEAAAVERARHKLLTVGVEAAVEGLIDVVRNVEAPAPARSTAGTSLIRAAGFFDRSETGKQRKELHEMTADELAKHSADLERDLAAIEAARAGRPVDDDEGVFS